MKYIIFLADGFEEVEALTVVDYLRRVDIDIETVSINKEYNVIGAHNIEVIADKKIEDIKSMKDFQGIIIPGGMPGSTNLRDDNRVIDLVKQANDEDKMVAAICAGPIVLDKAGIIQDKDVTSFPGFEDKLKGANYREDIVVRDGNIITSRGPYLAADFAMEIVRYILGEDKVNELKESILYNMKR